jgi:hypothetical protein
MKIIAAFVIMRSILPRAFDPLEVTQIQMLDEKRLAGAVVLLHNGDEDL